ncbi:MAG: hypothetical protein ACP5I6_01455 [Caldisphaera sp.]|jgi:hypothetical protein|nr:hypothetical protein [Caldisphaera sp.]
MKSLIYENFYVDYSSNKLNEIINLMDDVLYANYKEILLNTCLIKVNFPKEVNN